MRVKGWITPAHHLLYNIIRGVPIEKGFAPMTLKRKAAKFIAPCHASDQYVMRHHYYKDGFRDAVENFIEIIKNARCGYDDIVRKGHLRNMTFFNLQRTREFLEPFNDSVILADLCSIDTEILSDHLRLRFKQFTGVDSSEKGDIIYLNDRINIPK